MARAVTVTDPVVEIEELRRQIAAFQSQITELLRADTLCPQSESEDRVRDLVKIAGAQGGAPRDELVAQSITRLSSKSGAGIIEVLNKRHGFSLLCALLPELVEKSLIASLPGVYDGTRPVLSSEEQGERRRVLEEQLFDLELEEERIISQLESRGRPTPMRRGDANPAAVLHETTLSAMESGYETD